MKIEDGLFDSHQIDTLILSIIIIIVIVIVSVVVQARARAISEDAKLASACVADARDLSNIFVKDSIADLVLLLGPMYHLTERQDRVEALKETRIVIVVMVLLFVSHR